MKIKRIITGAALLIAAGASYSTAQEYGMKLIEDFNRTRFVGPRGDAHNAWEVNPDDPTSGVKASFERVDDGHALRLLYNVDSASSYIFDQAYITDYSEFHLIGLAEEVPHRGAGGYFFMLGEADLRDYNYLVFSVMGDYRTGFTRRFKIQLKTEERTSSYIFDGVTSRWNKVAIPLRMFADITDFSRVTELNIVFDESVTAERGALYFNDIYFSHSPQYVPRPFGMPLRTPTPVERVHDYRVHSLVNVGVNYRNTPEFSNEIFSSGELVMQGTAGRLGGRIRARAESIEFGRAFYREETEGHPYYKTGRNNPQLSIPTMQISIDELTPLASRITVGDLFLGYSQYIFQPSWGWRGVKVDGAFNGYDHSSFLIKRHHNSFSAGSRNLYYAGNHRLQFIGVYDYETARIGLGGDELDIRKVSDEFSYLTSLLLRFNDRKVNLEGTYGSYSYQRHATADYEYPSDPEYNQEVDVRPLNDQMFKVDLFMDGLIYRGSRVLLRYREIGTDFLPAYRQEPGVFESVQGDQRGVSIDARQWLDRWGATLFVNRASRISDRDYGTNIVNYGIAYRGASELEVRLNIENKAEDYFIERTGDRFPRDRETAYDVEVDSIILAARYNFIHSVEPGMRFPLSADISFREDRIEDKNEGKKETVHSLMLGVNYQLRTDFGFSAEWRASTKNNPEIQTDNSFNLYLNSSF